MKIHDFKTHQDICKIAEEYLLTAEEYPSLAEEYLSVAQEYISPAEECISPAAENIVKLCTTSQVFGHQKYGQKSGQFHQYMCFKYIYLFMTDREQKQQQTEHMIYFKRKLYFSGRILGYLVRRHL